MAMNIVKGQFCPLVPLARMTIIETCFTAFGAFTDVVVR